MTSYDPLRDIMALSARCAAVLAHHPPHLQGAALADLLATWLAGHPPPVREELLAMHVAMVRRLVAAEPPP